MADVFNTVQKLINSPPAQVAAGGALGWLVWMFFARVGAGLADNTKCEIAAWVLGSKPIGPDLQRWLGLFVKMLDRVFGEDLVASRWFWRCSLASISVTVIAWLCIVQLPSVRSGLFYAPDQLWWPLGLLLFVATYNILVDYALLIKTRCALKIVSRCASTGLVLVLLGDLLVTAAMSGVPLYIFEKEFTDHPLVSISKIAAVKDAAGFQRGKEYLRTSYLAPAMKQSILSALDAKRSGQNFKAAWLVHRAFWFALFGVLTVCSMFPALFVQFWFGLYTGCGLLLKAAHRYDFGFDWFNRRFDIEIRPLHSIGVVAGAVVAIAYWGAVVLSQVL